MNNKQLTEMTLDIGIENNYSIETWDITDASCMQIIREHYGIPYLQKPE